MAARFEINCTYVLGLACKGAAILEINKQMMKTNNIRKLVQKNYVTNLYKNWGCPMSVTDFFFLRVQKKKKKKKKRITVGAFFDSRLGNRKHHFFFQALYIPYST